MAHPETRSFVRARCECLYTGTLISVLRREAVADEDVLADFVIALLGTDKPKAQLREDAARDLEDFLKESGSFALLGETDMEY